MCVYLEFHLFSLTFCSECLTNFLVFCILILHPTRVIQKPPSLLLTSSRSLIGSSSLNISRQQKEVRKEAWKHQNAGCGCLKPAFRCSVHSLTVCIVCMRRAVKPKWLLITDYFPITALPGMIYYTYILMYMITVERQAYFLSVSGVDTSLLKLSDSCGYKNVMLTCFIPLSSGYYTNTAVLNEPATVAVLWGSFVNIFMNSSGKVERLRSFVG